MSDRGIGLGTLVFGGILLVATLLLPEAMLGDPMGPRLWPLILAAMLLLIGTGIVVTSRPAGAQVGEQPCARPAGSRVRFWGVAAITILYPDALTPLGYLAATALALLATLAVYNSGRWVVNTTVAVGFSVASYLLFHTLLGVYVPPGLLR